jgi:uncharacterized protein YjbI with pentapeptide repeats
VALDGYAGSWSIVGSSLVSYDGDQYVREEYTVEREPQTTRDRALLLLRATLLPGWQPTAGQALVWVIRGAIVLGVFYLIASAVDKTVFGKTVWDWLDLLIVPAALALAGYWFTSVQNRAAQRAAQADAERLAQDEIEQGYIDRMRQLMLDNDLRNERNTSDLRTLARSYTLSALDRLDGRHKRNVIRFLYASGLIYADVPRVIALDGADLTEADLGGMSLCGRIYHAGDLFGETNLKARAEQLGVYLSEIAQPTDTVNLTSVDLSGANLRGADLGGAILMFADLNGADLSGANLSYAHLEGARGISEQQLHEQCKLLIGATMPNRQKYEDWYEDCLKSKGSGEDGENPGLQ